METEVQAAVIGSGIAVVSALLGYAFREWRNHAKPFLAITGFAAGFLRSSTETEISKDVVSQLKGAFSIERLSAVDRIANIQSSATSAGRICEELPAAIRRIDELCELLQQSASDELIIDALADLIEPPFIDYCLVLLLTKGRITVTNPSPGLPSKLAVYQSDQNGGCLAISFPGKAVTFGQDLHKEPLIKERVRPFVKSIETLDIPALLAVWKSVRRQFASEYEVAKDVHPKLDQLLDAHSRWEVRVFFANLRSTPVLVEPQAYLSVRDNTGATFHELCDMALQTEKESGEIIRRPSDSPVVIPSGESKALSFFTRNTQQKMQRGQAFRECFASGQAVAKLTLTIRGVGLLRRSSISTSTERFVEA